MKQIIITIIKFIGFFLGWAILTSVLPLSSCENPAMWRLWAEIMPLLAMIAFTFIFWLIEKKTVRLYLFDNPVRGVVIGTVTGTIWLAIPVLVMFMARIMHFDGTNAVKQVSPKYVSCVIQINADTAYVSDSPYLQAFGRLEEIHHQMEETALVNAMKQIGYRKALQKVENLPNGKKLDRIDFSQ